MSGRFIGVCVLGLASSLFLGYCVYFDRKRRMDPDYKKKVLARRRRAKAKGKVIDLRDPRVREEFLIGEMTAANQKMMEGNIEETIAHLLNFVKYSGNPRATLLTLQQTLPLPIFNLLVRAVAATSSAAGPPSTAQGKQSSLGAGGNESTAAAVEVD